MLCKKTLVSDWLLVGRLQFCSSVCIVSVCVCIEVVVLKHKMKNHNKKTKLSLMYAKQSQWVLDKRATTTTTVLNNPIQVVNAVTKNLNEWVCKTKNVDKPNMCTHVRTCVQFICLRVCVNIVNCMPVCVWVHVAA